MIHSILPIEAIMDAEKSRGELGQSRNIAIQNGFVRTICGAGGQVRVESLFSTDPYDYLNPRYQPGNTW